MPFDTAEFVRQPGDPAWANDPEMLAYLAFMKKYAPDLDPDDKLSVFGYYNGAMVAALLRQCGDNLTRENLLEQATHPPDDYAPIKQMQLQRFDGTGRIRIGGIAGGQAAERNPVAVPVSLSFMVSSYGNVRAVEVPLFQHKGHQGPRRSHKGFVPGGRSFADSLWPLYLGGEKAGPQPFERCLNIRSVDGYAACGRRMVGGGRVALRLARDWSSTKNE